MTPGDPAPPAHDSARWERITEIFSAALEVPSRERMAWLAALAGIDEDLRREVASLLEANETAGGFLDRRR